MKKKQKQETLSLYTKLPGWTTSSIQGYEIELVYIKKFQGARTNKIMY